MPRPPDPDRPQEERWCASCNAVTVHRLHSRGGDRTPAFRCVPCMRHRMRRYYETHRR